MTSIQEKQLGQVRATTGGTAESLYSPGSGVTAIIKTIVVCNQTGSADTFCVFLDDDGSTYTEETTLFKDVAIGANETIQINCWYAMNNAAGNLAVEGATTDAVTFTAFGLEVS